MFKWIDYSMADVSTSLYIPKVINVAPNLWAS